MYCTNCGREIDDNAAVCVGCGHSVEKKGEKDAPSKGFAILGFFIPIVGLILYLVYQSTCPLKAKSAGKGALIGFIVSIILSVLLVVGYFVLIGLFIALY